MKLVMMLVFVHDLCLIVCSNFIAKIKNDSFACLRLLQIWLFLIRFETPYTLVMM